MATDTATPTKKVGELKRRDIIEFTQSNQITVNGHQQPTFQAVVVDVKDSVELDEPPTPTVKVRLNVLDDQGNLTNKLCILTCYNKDTELSSHGSHEGQLTEPQPATPQGPGAV